MNAFNFCNNHSLLLIKISLCQGHIGRWALFSFVCVGVCIFLTITVCNFCHGIEQGRRNSVVVGRDGFEELYMFSPGSSHESYGKYAYICVGQSAMLKPIVLGPNESWTGGQRLHNPNL